MVELDTKPQFIPNLPTKGLVEGLLFAFERNGKYYLTFPHAIKTERLEYAMADSPMGPYKMAGVIMDESPSWMLDESSFHCRVQRAVVSLLP